MQSYESSKKSYIRKAALTSQSGRVSLKFLAIISFKFTYVSFSLVSRGTCSGGFLAAALQRVGSIKRQVAHSSSVFWKRLFFFNFFSFFSLQSHSLQKEA